MTVSLGVAWTVLPAVVLATRSTVRTVKLALLIGGDWLPVPVWDQDDGGSCRTQWLRHGTKVITRNLDVDRGLCHGARC